MSHETSHQNWQIDSQRSKLTFTLRHLVVSEIRGQFREWGGGLILDRDDVSRSRCHVWVEMGSVDTGDPERDGHVRSAEFLDVARHPRAEFHSDAVDENADGSVRVTGTLRLRDAAKAVELRIEERTPIDAPRPESAGPATGVGHRAFVARGTLNRQAFGLHWNQDLDVGGVVLGDEIAIEAELQLTLDPEAPTPAA
jgi:polyisoprenoid-binding protein YceI